MSASTSGAWTQTDEGRAKLKTKALERWANLSPEGRAVQLARLQQGKKRAIRLKKMAIWRRKNGKVTGARKTKYFKIKVRSARKDAAPVTNNAAQDARHTAPAPPLPAALTAALVKITAVVNDPNDGRSVMETFSIPENRVLDQIAELIHNGHVWYEIRMERAA